jgi:hypothetical protein
MEDGTGWKSSKLSRYRLYGVSLPIMTPRIVICREQLHKKKTASRHETPPATCHLR